jgi:(2Fe-2S) ferredoxin
MSTTFDAILFAISAPNLSKRRLEDMRRQSAASTPLPSMLIQLEGTSTSLPDALDKMSASHSRILVQPLGLPFPEGLLTWLPGAIAHWRQDRHRPDLDIAVGRDVGTFPAVIERSVELALADSENAIDVANSKPSLGKRGWQDPPDFTYHLFVCTGPRCHYRDAASLHQALKQETLAQGVSEKCITTRAGCMFPCNQGPLVAVYPKGEWYHLPDADSVRQFVSNVLVDGGQLPDRLIHVAKVVREAGRHDA